MLKLLVLISWSLLVLIIVNYIILIVLHRMILYNLFLISEFFSSGVWNCKTIIMIEFCTKKRMAIAIVILIR